MLRIDLHLHSSASLDCRVEPRAVLERCRRLGLDRIFLTDHNSIEGARQLRIREPDYVLAGEEISTTEGELIGLFLEESVPAGLTPDEAVAGIQEQGGLVYLEHPYDEYRRHLSEAAIERIADAIQIVEVFNARCTDQANARAEDLRATLGAAPGAGSDAHTLDGIGAAFVEMEDFRGPQDFLAKLHDCRVVKHPNRALLELGARLRWR